MDDYRDLDEALRRGLLRAIAEADFLARESHCKTPGSYNWQCRNASIIAEARQMWPDEEIRAHIAQYVRDEPSRYA